jgi:hypothetical protein
MKEKQEVHYGRDMLSRSQEKLLRYLGTFPEALDQAWDVPRDLSLPGLAEAMGVVRSGLNRPLSLLESEQLITVRIAHVIGGGSRRRQVYHASEKGRLWLLKHPEIAEVEKGEYESKQNHPPTELIGRKDTLLDLESLFGHHEPVFLGGLSGIGKTTVAQALTGRASVEGTSTHSAVVNEFSDLRDIIQQWFPTVNPLPHDTEALASLLEASDKKQMFVIDDVHLISQRHASKIKDMIETFQCDNSTTLLLVGRTPLQFNIDCEYRQLPALDPEDATQLLGEHLDLEHRLSVAKALGGHPMALQLYSEGTPLPEAGEDIQKFVEQTILQNLGDEELAALDHFVLFPRPLASKEVPHQDEIADLDVHALLRWEHDNTKLEIQHLVRNVRRTMFSSDRLKELHQQSLNHWLLCEDTPDSQILRLYHQLALDDPDFHSQIGRQVERLLPAQGAAIAVILNRAVEQKPDDEMLHYWAGKVALHRHETDQAQIHLDSLSDESLRSELAYQKALLEGNEVESKLLLNAVLAQANDVEAARTLLSAAVQQLEDRLFDEPSDTASSSIHSLLQDVKLPQRQEYRTAMMVSLSMIQHAVSLFEGDSQRANELRDALASISDEHDPFVRLLKLKASFCFHSSGSLEELIAEAEAVIQRQPTDFHKAALGLTLAEFLWIHDSQRAQSVFADVPQPDTLQSKGVSQQRYAGRWWYLHSKLSPNQALMSMREASRCFRSAGCHSASRTLVKRMHRLL